MLRLVNRPHTCYQRRDHLAAELFKLRDGGIWTSTALLQNYNRTMVEAIVPGAGKSFMCMNGFPNAIIWFNQPTRTGTSP